MHNNYDFNKNKLIAILSCMQSDAYLSAIVI